MSKWLPLKILEGRRGSNSMKGVQQNSAQDLTLARGLFCLPPIKRLPVLHVLGYKSGSPKNSQHKVAARGPNCVCASENQPVTKTIKNVLKIYVLTSNCMRECPGNN